MRINRFVTGKPTWLPFAIIAVLILVFTSLLLDRSIAAPSSGYNLEWWTVDAGGGNSSGGGYSLSSGIAQPDAESMSGGNYQLQGGFWQGTTYLIHLPLVVR